MANLKDNVRASSPIVSALVLCIVVVVGTVAVGAITGTYSTDVSKQANADEAAQVVQSVSGNEILISGANFMGKPMGDVADHYMAKNPGTTIIVKNGLATASCPNPIYPYPSVNPNYPIANGMAPLSLSYLENEYVGIQTFIGKMDPAQRAAYPNFREYEVGYDGMVVIVNSSVPVTSNISKSDLKKALSGDLSGSTIPPGVMMVMADNYDDGYSETFTSFIGLGDNPFSTSYPAVLQICSNGLTIKYVANNTGSIGYTNLANALDPKHNGAIKIIAYEGTPKTHESDTDWPQYTWQSVRDAKTGVKNPLNFPKGAIYPLELLTKDEPTQLQRKIISFAQAGDEAVWFHNHNYTHISDI